MLAFLELTASLCLRYPAPLWCSALASAHVRHEPPENTKARRPAHRSLCGGGCNRGALQCRTPAGHGHAPQPVAHVAPHAHRARPGRCLRSQGTPRPASGPRRTLPEVATACEQRDVSAQTPPAADRSRSSCATSGAGRGLLSVGQRLGHLPTGEVPAAWPTSPSTRPCRADQPEQVGDMLAPGESLTPQHIYIYASPNRPAGRLHATACAPCPTASRPQAACCQRAVQHDPVSGQALHGVPPGPVH